MFVVLDLLGSGIIKELVRKLVDSCSLIGNHIKNIDKEISMKGPVNFAKTCTKFFNFILINLFFSC